MPVITPAMGTAAVGGQPRWYRFVRRLATRPSSELSLVYVPDGTHDRLAVLKRLPPILATDPTAVEKFRIEARIAAMLEHPAIVRVFELVETMSEDFYTMEYVRGADMRQLMDALVQQRRTLPLDCVLLIAIELCNALDYAHHLTDANGLPAPVIHRELSPSKVLLGVDGSIKLTGFSAPPITRSKRPRRSRTESVGYTSPECCLGEAIDARSDVFALGVLLYELSSGERLFTDATTEHQVLTKLMRGDMPRPSEVRRGYPRELEAILMRALARDRQQRHQSVAELQTELETFLWSRWPTASTAALAKLVATAFPSDENTDLATGSRELERIDPFAAEAAPPSEQPALWLGPVPLAKPFLRVGDAPPRTDTKELKRLAPETFPDASNVDVTLGAPGPKARLEDLKRPVPASPATTATRAATIDELAIPVEQTVVVDSSEVRTQLRDDVDDLLAAASADRLLAGLQQTVVKPTDVVLGTPGPKPAPLGLESSPRARAFAAVHAPAQGDRGSTRGQYQRPAALDEQQAENREEVILERLRPKQRELEGPTTVSSSNARQRSKSSQPRAKTNDRLSSANVFRTRRPGDGPSHPRAVDESNANLARTWNGDELDNPGIARSQSVPPPPRPSVARTRSSDRGSNPSIPRTQTDRSSHPNVVARERVSADLVDARRPTASIDIDLSFAGAGEDDGVTIARPRSSEESQSMAPCPPRSEGSSAAPVPVPAAATPVPFDRAKRAETAGVDAQAEFDLDKVSQLNWTLIPSPPAANPVDAIRQRLPSPPLAVVAGRKTWPLGTIAAIVSVVLVGVVASAWAIRNTQHEPSDLPEVITALPSPPMDVVLHTTQKARPVPAAAAVASDAKKPKAPRAAAAMPPAVKKEPARAASNVQSPAIEQKPPEKAIPPLFPPPDRLPVPPGAGSLDGLPSIRTIEVKGTTADLAIRKAVEQALSPLRGCYRMAARAKQLTPQVDLTIAFDIDARRVPVKVHAIGGGALDALASCAAKVTSDMRDLPGPASGAASVHVSVSLEFRPNP